MQRVYHAVVKVAATIWLATLRRAAVQQHILSLRSNIFGDLDHTDILGLDQPAA